MKGTHIDRCGARDAAREMRENAAKAR